MFKSRSCDRERAEREARCERVACVGFRDLHGADGELTGELVVDRVGWEHIESVI